VSATITKRVLHLLMQADKEGMIADRRHQRTQEPAPYRSEDTRDRWPRHGD
jgi:hypothetical protein